MSSSLRPIPKFWLKILTGRSKSISDKDSKCYSFIFQLNNQINDALGVFKYSSIENIGVTLVGEGEVPLAEDLAILKI